VSSVEQLLHTPFGWMCAGLWGAMWGSFFNVCIYRIGLYESVVRPRSRCPSCGRFISGIDNVPMLSWLVLGGRCRHCKTPISIRYPLVELLATLLALAIFWRFVATAEGDPIWLISRFFVYFAFAGTLVVLAGIDFDHMLLPDRITMPAIPIFLVAGILLRDLPPVELLCGIPIGYGLVAVTAELAYLILKREGMGYGDAKLLAVVGALLGWRGAVVTFFGAPFAGLLVLLPILLLRRRKLFGTEVPYGPFLIVAALAYLLFGHYLPAPLTFLPN
jgi:leader peptidase (prepilin peptidase) / N-methyltransferase